MLLIFSILTAAAFMSSVYSEDTPAPVCQPGTFKTTTGCVRCSRLKFSTTTDARFCRRCPPSQEASPDRTSCVPLRCDLGWYLPIGKVKCRICPENSYSTTTDATECTPCSPNTKSMRGATSPADCIRCPIGRVVERNYMFDSISCSRCSHFRSTFTISADECVDCIPGTFRNNVNWADGRCFPCHPGRYAPGQGHRHCFKCTDRYQPAMGASTCIPCPPGSASDVSARFCISTCVSGSPGCVNCGAGHAYNRDTKRCESCAPGSVSPKGAITECIPCRGGSTPNAARSRCLCDPGFTYRVADESCQRCPPGTTSTDGGKCNSCVLNGRSSAGCFCPPLMENVNNTCVSCTPNYYNRRTCRRCERNEKIDEVLGTCVPCPPDTWSDSPGTKICKPCPADTTRPAGELNCKCKEENEAVIDGKCTLCPAGKESSYNSIIQMPTCLDCFSGEFNDKPGGTCEDCPRGRRPSGYGNTKCLDPCPPKQEREDIGFFADEGECVCVSNHAPVTKGGTLTCNPCKSGEVIWKNKCVCQSKVYSGVNNSVCEPCPENRYGFGGRCRCFGGTIPTDDGGCEPCPAGTFSRSKRCVECPPGLVALTPGRWYCYRCPTGTKPEGPAKCV